MLLRKKSRISELVNSEPESVSSLWVGDLLLEFKFVVITEIYCVKCKKKTETSSEVQDMTDKGQYQIHSDCIIYGTHKNTLTGENWEVKRHSKRKILDAKKKRKKTAINKKAKKLGLKILDANENVQTYIKRYLRDATKEG
ncbi:hypothetical protein RclHR1_08550010 [Rhizophagus clarus]|uniref:DUF5679 domain-containing protein n=1 Tax=Rhizophagus clarus TaxID=94130 RepID=A0A2Z6S1G3_9GLOM|nr:hypothetical protein RclHR1_08550010 [Rhizophagus clarus]